MLPLILSAAMLAATASGQPSATPLNTDSPPTAPTPQASAHPDTSSFAATRPAASSLPPSAQPVLTPRIPTPAPSGFPAEGDGRPARTGGSYYYSRWAEDWSFLRDPSKSADLFDPLKFIPLNADKSAYLTLSGTARIGVVTLDNVALNPKGKPLDAGLFRGYVGADLHLTPWLRFYGELATAEIGGSNFHSDLPIYRSSLFIHQAFGEVNGEFGGAKVMARVGRQDFTDGPQQIVSTRDIPNLQFEFNGVRAAANWSSVRVDVIDFRSTRFGPQVFDTNTNWDEQLYGLNTSIVVPRVYGTKLFLDPFYFGYTNQARSLGGVVGREDVSSYGGRLWGEIGPVRIDWVGDRQTGSFDSRPVDAFSIYSSQSILVADTPYQPRVGFRADEASGGGAYGRGTVHDNDYMFGSAPYLSDGLLLSGQNLIDFAPNVSIQPVKPLILSAEYAMLWRYNDQDSVYNILKAPYAGVQNVRGYHTGNLLRLKAIYAINAHLSVSTTVEYLQAGEGLKRANLGDAVFSGSYLNLRF